MNTLTIIRGLPGSGKSTFAKSLGVFHVEADMYHMKNGLYSFDVSRKNDAHRWCKDVVMFALANKMDCVVSNTFTQKWEIDPYIKIAKECDADIKIYRMIGKFESIHNVPEDVIKSMEDRFENIEFEIIKESA